MSDAAEETHAQATEAVQGFFIQETLLEQSQPADVHEPRGLALEQLIEKLTTEEQRYIAEGLEVEPETHWFPLYEALLQSNVLLVVSKACLHPGSRTIITMAHETVQFPVFSRLDTAMKDEDRATFFDFVWVKFSTLCRLAIEQGAEGILLNADGPIDILFDYYEMKYMAENQLPPQRPVLHEQVLNKASEPAVLLEETPANPTAAFHSMRFISRAT